ncbi:MAG: recombinase family protein [Oscillospiraceae bacterium]|nr:recombinase family protein [Oscillospiraceae bacterium]
MKIAIYSGKFKFTGKGESIGNRIQLCREYISLHFPEARDNEIFVFEDEGFSAKNLDRPPFRALHSAKQMHSR